MVGRTVCLFVIHTTATRTSCVGGRHNMLPPPVTLTFDLESGVLSHLWLGLPLCQF